MKDIFDNIITIGDVVCLSSVKAGIGAVLDLCLVIDMHTVGNDIQVPVVRRFNYTGSLKNYYVEVPNARERLFVLFPDSVPKEVWKTRCIFMEEKE